MIETVAVTAFAIVALVCALYAFSCARSAKESADSLVDDIKKTSGYLISILFRICKISHVGQEGEFRYRTRLDPRYNPHKVVERRR